VGLDRSGDVPSCRSRLAVDGAAPGGSGLIIHGVGAAEHGDLAPEPEELDVLVVDVRPINRSSPSTCWKISYNRRNDTAEIMPGRWRSPITAGQRYVQHSGTRQACSARRAGRLRLLGKLSAKVLGPSPECRPARMRGTAAAQHRLRSFDSGSHRQLSWLAVEAARCADVVVGQRAVPRGLTLSRGAAPASAMVVAKRVKESRTCRGRRKRPG